jgi:hypothetical protein
VVAVVAVGMRRFGTAVVEEGAVVVAIVAVGR